MAGGVVGVGNRAGVAAMVAGNALTVGTGGMVGAVVGAVIVAVAVATESNAETMGIAVVGRGTGAVGTEGGAAGAKLQLASTFTANRTTRNADRHRDRGVRIRIQAYMNPSCS